MRKRNFWKAMLGVSFVSAGLVLISSCSKEEDVGVKISSVNSAGQKVGTGQYNYSVGPDYAVAESSQGLKVKILGSGTLSIQSKSVTGTGDYFSDDPALGIGTWTAIQLLSFEPYVGDPTTCPEYGGMAVIKVKLDSEDAVMPDKEAVLELRCCSGEAPTSCDEGVRLDVKGGTNFNQEISGTVCFAH